MTFLVVGARGFLGTYLIRRLLSDTDEEIVATCRGGPRPPDRRRLRWAGLEAASSSQVSELASTFLDKSALKIFYLAAMHNPDQVENNPDESFTVNIRALADFLLAFGGSRILYPSSDSVYGEGEIGRPFRESDALNPINLYGRQKAAAESLVTARGQSVVRLPFLFGPSLAPGKLHFFDRLIRDISAGQPVEMLADSVRSALDFGTAADLWLRLAQIPERLPPVINLSGDLPLSKYDLGLSLARRLGRDEALARPIFMEAAGFFSAPRARRVILDNALLKRTLGLEKVEAFADLEV